MKSREYAGNGVFPGFFTFSGTGKIWILTESKSKFILLYEKFFRNIRNENAFFLIVIIRGGVCICGL